MNDLDQRLLSSAMQDKPAETLAALEAGANVNARDAQQNTALHWAAGQGDVELVQTLLAKKADIEAKDIADRTPLHWAAMGGHVGTAQALMEKGAMTAALDIAQKTPLAIAKEFKNAAVAEALSTGKEPLGFAETVSHKREAQNQRRRDR